MTQPLPDYVVAGEGESSLVFLHGLGGDHTNWQPQLAEFSPHYRCIAWTMPGFGVSPSIEAFTWPVLSDLLARVLTEVGVERATIIGLSMGGYVAQQFAADHGDRVDRLVLAATTAQFGRGSTSFADKFLAARLAPLDDGQVPADFAAEVVKGLLSEDAPDSVVASCVASMSRISGTAYRQALECLVTWNFVDRLDEIIAPTLCIAGANDRTAPVAAMQALAEGLPDGRLEVIDECSHLINLDHPHEFNQLLHQFLTICDPTR